MELGKRSIQFCKDIEITKIVDLRIMAEKYLSKKDVLDNTISIPHIQLKRSLKYFDFFLVDALFKGTDNKLYWSITISYEEGKEDIRGIQFEDIPIWLIFACLKQIDSMINDIDQ